MKRFDSLEKTLMLGGIRDPSLGEGDDRGWDGWMASPTQWTWVWVNSWSWWWTGRPGVLRFMGSPRVGHDWLTELNWIEDYYDQALLLYILRSLLLPAVRSRERILTVIEFLWFSSMAEHTSHVLPDLGAIDLLSSSLLDQRVSRYPHPGSAEAL